MNILKKFKRLFDPIDLTNGKIAKVFILFLIPIILSTLFQQVYTLTDTIIVGKNLNSNEVAGVNNAATMSSMILNFTIGCTAGFSVILSKSVGAKNFNTARKSVFVQLILAFVIAIILTITAYLLINPLLAWIKITPSETNPDMNEIYNSAKTYLTILFIGGITSQMLYNMVGAILRALGDSFTPFLFLVMATMMNVVLDLTFIIPLKMGVAGSALATVLSQLFAAVGAFVYAFVRYKELRLKKEDLKVSWKFVFDHLKLGLPLGLQWTILDIGVVVMSAAVIPFDMISATATVTGNPAQLGYGVSNKFSGLMMGFFSATGNALLSYISQNKGANKIDRIKDGFKFASILTICTALMLMTLGFLLSINGAYLYIFLSKDKINSQTIHFGNTYLYIALPFYIPLGLIYVGRNSIQALEKPLYPLLSGVVELLTRTLICTFIPTLINGGAINSTASNWSYISICFADPITWIASMCVVIIPTIIELKKLGKANKL